MNDVQKIQIPNLDKVVHFIFYTTSSFLWCWALLNKKTTNNQFNTVLINLGLILFGLLIEFLQDAMPTHRSFEWLDVLSNTAGVLFGNIIYILYTKFKPHYS
ncbi:VanZ family protein [Myroides sp. JBRI-B21084]|uniref:VanZ family protein n=1 Tax=Myroides sp. JBRI-B21084 TaxID=3119977 RepID=UPI0026E19FAF|nr:VanZ family protein [Paenimyroides cloacae]WKW47194.1 VanZ family protein [Paenimyroides cloacae]